MHPVLSHRNYLNQRNQHLTMASEETSEPLFSRWRRAVIRQWKRRKMTAALQALDDWTLDDIGLRRSDIKRVVDAFDDRELGMQPLASNDVHTIAEQAAMQRAC
ncbi:DUF1127 domain-containing protein [Aliiroseovarius zhejiangensis]|nr:DUF1127 domain-containing protein [Aliiroseovarius zhejiangensis]